MPGYTVRTPYRVDEPSLGVEEHEMGWNEHVRIDPTGALLVVTADPETRAHDAVVRAFAPGAWISFWYGLFKDDIDGE
jgi:hypothetical protein